MVRENTPPKADKPTYYLPFNIPKIKEPPRKNVPEERTPEMCEAICLNGQLCTADYINSRWDRKDKRTKRYCYSHMTATKWT